MFKTSSLVAALCVFTLSTATAQDYRIEVIDEGPDAEEISADIAKQISDKGIRVIKGTSRTVCEIWLLKELAVDPEFKPTEERLYPFSLGQLIGVLHFRRRGSDFRDQQVSSGWYTMRFGLQPVDGNHEGTSPTRDFVLLIDAEQDEFPEAWDGEESLHESSAEAAGSSHPAMIGLQRSTDADANSLRHDESNDWWIAHVVGKGMANDKPQDVPIDMVVVGHAAE